MAFCHSDKKKMKVKLVVVNEVNVQCGGGSLGTFSS
jgi:hypothetical protein